MQTPGLRTDVSQLPFERLPNIHEANAIAADADTCDFLLEALIAGFAATRKQPGGHRPRGNRGERR